MRKSVVALFCILLLITSLWGARNPKSSIAWLFGTNPRLNAWRIGTAGALLLFGFVPLFEESMAGRMALLIGATILAALFLQNQLIIPTESPAHVRFFPLDTFMAIEAIVMASIMAIAPTEDELSDEIASIHAKRRPSSTPLESKHLAPSAGAA